MRKKNHKISLITRGIRVHMQMNRAMKAAGINVSELSRDLLEGYAEKIGLKWKDEL